MKIYVFIILDCILIYNACTLDIDGRLSVAVYDATIYSIVFLHLPSILPMFYIRKFMFLSFLIVFLFIMHVLLDIDGRLSVAVYDATIYSIVFLHLPSILLMFYI